MAARVDADDLAALSADPRVSRIWVDQARARPQLDASTALIGMTGTTGAYIAGADGLDTTIAVLDTGMQTNHPFLQGKVIEEACYSTTEPQNASVSVCPNRRGSMVGPGSAATCTFPGCSHGTHVAGIAAGKNPVSSGVPANGVAKESNLIAIQVFSGFSRATECAPLAAPCVLAYDADIMAGLDHVLTRVITLGERVAAVNMSLGAGKYDVACDNEPIKFLIDELKAMNVATIIASGNDGFTDSVAWPACVSTAITVGASKASTIGTFSNSSPLVDLVAPGVDIVSSLPGGTYAKETGTSMSTPHVAGAFAALRSLFPAASVDQIETSLKSTGDAVVDGRNSLSRPRIRVDLAVEALRTLLGGGGGTRSSIGMLAATLPYARSVQVGTTSTIFATMLNPTGTDAVDCLPSMPNGVVAGSFSYQAADAANALVGSVNTPVPIAAGRSQQFIIGVTPTAPFGAVDIPLAFKCQNFARVPLVSGLNTMLLSSSATTPPDLIAIGATVSNDGIMTVGQSGGVFSTAVVNIGPTSPITASVDINGTGMPLLVSICQTNPATGVCLAPAVGAGVGAQAPTGQPLTFAIFARATGPIALDPALKRVFVRFSAGGVVRGATSVAVRTSFGDQPAAVAESR